MSHSFVERRSPIRLIVTMAAVAVLAAAASACQNGKTGPSLSASVDQASLRSTIEGNPNVCCCHIAGNLVNTSTVAIDAELRFPAKDNAGQPVGTALDTESNVPPGGTRPFVAVGITTACKNLDLNQILADKLIRLRGLWNP